MDFTAKKLIKLGFFAGMGYTLWQAFAWGAMALFTWAFLSGCMTTPTSPPEVVFIIDGNVSEIVVETEHPCEGNWNFCDHVLSLETLVVPGEDDEYGSYVYPEFKSHFLVHESEVKK